MLGAIIGDVVGSVYEFNNIKTKDFPLFSKRTRPTDDSIMTLAVAECIQNDLYDNNEDIVKVFKKWCKAYPNAGYGGRFFNWIFSNNTEPYNSCGNGSAMRISAAGWYGRDEEEVKELAYKLTAVTHNHPEGLKGAEVTAMCIYYARIGKSKEFIKEYVSQYYDINFDYEELRRTYVHAEEICQVTVPQAIFCFLISTDFEDCLRTTISIGGDCDTTAAISCAIAEAYYKDIDVDIIKNTLEILQRYDVDGKILEIINNLITYKSLVLTHEEKLNENTMVIGIEEYVNNSKSINFIHSSSVKVLLEYLLWFYIWNNESIMPTDVYLNINNHVRNYFKTNRFEDIDKVVEEFKVSGIKYDYFNNMEEVVEFLNANYDLNDEHLNSILDQEYFR